MRSVHPVAALFPMLAGEELDALAADIKANGLQQAVVVKDGVLLDGRNRLAACEREGVEPTFREYEGDNPTAFIVSANLKRRHLTREQRDAVIVGLREQGMTLTKISEAVGVSPQTVMRATSEIPDGKSEITNARGQLRPAHYAPREDGEGRGNREEPSRAPALPHVANNSGDNEWYTPPEHIAAARVVLGCIDLDPASHAEANEVVRAEKFYTAEDDGLAQEWAGRVWMNPPYAGDLIGKFVEKLAQEVEGGSVPEAIVLVNNATETRWFARLAGVAAFLCFPTGRVQFWHPRKESVPLQGQCFAYIGQNGSLFCEVFEKFGIIVEVMR